MATKAVSTQDPPGSSKAVRDAVSLSKESIDSNTDVGKLSNQLIMAMANDVAFKQVQAHTDMIDANALEAKRRKIEAQQEINQLEQKSKISAPVTQFGGFPGVGPIGMQQLSGGNAEVVKAALSALDSDEARLKYLEENKHLLYGGFPSVDAFSPLVPKSSSKGDSDIGSILTGMANLQLVQSQEARNNLLAMTQMQKQMTPYVPQYGSPGSPGSPGSQVPGQQSEDTKLLVSAVLKLAEAFSGGQNQMQAQIAQIKEDKIKTEREMWEKHLELQRQLEEERRSHAEEKYVVMVGSLQEEVTKLRTHINNDGGVRGEIAQLKNLIEHGKDLGLNLTNQTPDQDRAQREFDLEVAKLNMEKEIRLSQQQAEIARAQSFNNKIAALSQIVELGYDSMSMKKKLQNGNGHAVQSLSSGM
jgi:hypothetical protein